MQKMRNIAEEEVLQLQAELCKAVAHPKRLGIIYAIKAGEKGAGELAEELGLSLPTLSQHMRILRERGLVVARQEGRNVFYKLSDPRITEACNTMREFLKGWLAHLEGLSREI